MMVGKESAVEAVNRSALTPVYLHTLVSELAVNFEAG